MKKISTVAVLAVFSVYFLIACQRSESVRMGETSFFDSGLMVSGKVGSLSSDKFLEILLKQQEDGTLPHYCGFGEETLSQTQCKITIASTQADRIHVSYRSIGGEAVNGTFETDLQPTLTLEEPVFKSGVKYQLVRLEALDVSMDFILRDLRASEAALREGEGEASDYRLFGLVVRDPTAKPTNPTRFIFDKAQSPISPRELF